MMTRPQQSELQNERISPEEALISHFTAASLISQSSLQNEVVILKHDGDISDLKEQLEQKDAQIAALQKKVKDLEEKNNNLEITLEAKDEEVKNLKERIQTLEDEKESLQEELASVQRKLKAVEKDVKKLSKSRESDKENCSMLEGEMKKIHFALNEMKSDLADTKLENETLKKQVRHQSRYVPGAPLRLPVPANEDATALTNLGEMCWQIHRAIYVVVLPGSYTPIRNYKVAILIKDIEKLSKTEEDKGQALKRWEDLKTELQWSEVLEEALEVLQDTYKRSIDTAPPKLNESVLKKHAIWLESQGILKGWLSLERVNSLINIWKRLVECAGKA